MRDKQQRQLLELIDELVSNSEKPWVQKRDELLKEASEDETTSLDEFVSWFMD